MQELTLGLRLGSGLERPEQQWRELDHWVLNLQANQVFGNPYLADAIGSVFPLQSDAVQTGTYLTALNLERRAPLGGVGWKLGVMSLDPEVMSIPAYNFYVHSAFNDSYNITIPGYTFSPYANLGVLLTYRPDPASKLRYGLYAINSFEQLDGYGRLPATGQLNIQGDLQVLQYERRWDVADPRLARLRQDSVLPAGMVQIGAFRSSSQAQGTSQWGIQLGTSLGSYASLTLPLDLPWGLANRIWAAVSVGWDQQTNPVPLYGQLGWLCQGPLPGRPQDVLVVGYGRSTFSQTLPLLEEAVLELSYQVRLGPQLVLQPVLQWVFDPGGQGVLPTALNAGAQIQFQF
ncbi:MAG: carbohydrate porin [Synechococcaceae cyanobacterium]|nr:carbohydrate porin [Synechococcaceae cyanobacterium]